jgi:hypothetical protein
MDTKPVSAHQQDSIDTIKQSNPAVTKNLIKVYMDYLRKIKFLPKFIKRNDTLKVD